MLSEHDVRRRLDEEFVVWMTTVTPGGRPQSSPVWFLVEDGGLLIYSLTSARTRNVAANPKVAINLNSDFHGGQVVSMEGTATIDPAAPRASEHRPYLAKYRDRMASYGWTPDDFARDYSVAIRVTIDRIRNW